MFSLSGDSFWSNFGTNGQDAVVLLPSNALIFVDDCCISEIRCLSISPSPPVLCSMVNLEYILTGSNSSETVILTVI